MVRWPAVLDAVAFAAPPRLWVWACTLGPGRVDLRSKRVAALLRGGGPLRRPAPCAQRSGARSKALRPTSTVHTHPPRLSPACPTATEPIRSAVLEVAGELGVVVRDDDRGVTYCGDFHGQTGSSGVAPPRHHEPDALSLIVSSLAPGTDRSGVPSRPRRRERLGLTPKEREVEVVALCHRSSACRDRSRGIALRSSATWHPNASPRPRNDN